MQKFKNIEFLRIIGCVAIIMLHLFTGYKLYAIFPDCNLYQHLHDMTENGQKGVDLFFILSGFFFMYKFNYAQSLWDFLKNKFIRLYPALIFATFLSFLIAQTGIFKWNLYSNLLNLLCLYGTPLMVNNKGLSLGAFWYCSAMLWTMIFYRYLIVNYEKKNVNLWIGLIVFFCYSFLMQAKGGKINSFQQTFYYIFNVGLMRALGGIGIGYFIAEWYKNNAEKIKTVTLNIYQKLSVTALEFICLFYIINNLMLHKPKYNGDIIYIIAFLVIIILFLCKKGFISKLCDRDIYVNLAKYTYSIYITHSFIIKTLKCTIWKSQAELISTYPVLNIVFTIFVILIVGILTYHLVERPCINYFKNKSKKEN